MLSRQGTIVSCLEEEGAQEEQVPRSIEVGHTVNMSICDEYFSSSKNRRFLGNLFCDVTNGSNGVKFESLTE